MGYTQPDTAVILAAGLGSRLRSDQGPPKPLLPVRGRPLLLRVLDRFAEAEVQRAVIVVGHRADEIKNGVLAGRPSLQVEFAFNPHWQLNNGLSVLASRTYVGDKPFFLSMSDHIFDASLIRGLKQAPIPENGLVLAVDRKLSQIYDMEDATVVRTKDQHIIEIDKELESFDCVDTGLFACSPALYDAIESFSKTRENGDCTLSEGVKTLADRGLAMVHNIGEGLWQDVDTPGAAAHAETIFK